MTELPGAEPTTRNQNYRTELCRFRVEGCHRKHCRYAHSDEELRPRPRVRKYKKLLCQPFKLHGTCQYGERCTYRHDETIVRSAKAKNVRFLVSGKTVSKLVHEPGQTTALRKTFEATRVPSLEELELMFADLQSDKHTSHIQAVEESPSGTETAVSENSDHPSSDSQTKLTPVDPGESVASVESVACPEADVAFCDRNQDSSGVTDFVLAEQQYNPPPPGLFLTKITSPWVFYGLDPFGSTVYTCMACQLVEGVVVSFPIFSSQ